MFVDPKPSPSPSNLTCLPRAALLGALCWGQPCQGPLCQGRSAGDSFVRGSPARGRSAKALCRGQLCEGQPARRSLPGTALPGAALPGATLLGALINTLIRADATFIADVRVAVFSKTMFVDVVPPSTPSCTCRFLSVSHKSHITDIESLKLVFTHEGVRGEGLSDVACLVSDASHFA